MKPIFNAFLNFYSRLMFLIFIAIELADIIVIFLCLTKTLGINDVFYIRGIIGGLAILGVVLTMYTYLMPLCINNNFSSRNIPNVVNEVRFNKSIKWATNIPLIVSEIFSVYLLIIFKNSSNQDDIYKLMWVLAVFLPVCFKVGIYYLLWSKKVR